MFRRNGGNIRLDQFQLSDFLDSNGFHIVPPG
jgi:hypothetical protein